MTESAVGADVCCLHCGLDAGAARYCCYGCELAHQLIQEGDDDRRGTAAVLTLSLLLAMIVMMMSLFLYAEDVYEATSDPVFTWLREAYRWVAATLATPVVVMLAPPLARSAVRRLAERTVTMDLLIVVGATAAWLVSMGNVIRGGSAVYFDSAVGALVLATLGRFLEAKARARASQLVGHLLEPSASPVRVVSEPERIAPAAIRRGVGVRVPIGALVPVAGRVLRSVDVSLGVLTGESAPVTLMAGDTVPAGATPLSSELAAVALRPAKDSTLERISRLAHALRDRRGEVQRWADRLASVLTPMVALVALGALIHWGASSSWGSGIEVALAVVLVACPCTYGVITPLIMWIALRRALAHGVCIRSAQVVEAMARARAVAFDKTGTLTRPLRAVGVRRHDGGGEPVASLVAAIEAESRHPIGRALAAWAGDVRATLSSTRSVDGQGVVATDPNGRTVALGSPRLMSVLDVTVPTDARDASALLSIDGSLVASFVVDEELRADAAETIALLEEAGMSTVVLTGDRQGRATRIGDALGVETHAELSAADKVAKLEELGDGAVVVGDGLNDAPATAATLGIAVVGAASLNRGLADATLLVDDLRLVPWVLALSRRATRLARRTLAASTAYNVVFVAIAACGVLRPVWAGLSMLVASLLALGSALRLAHPPEQPRSGRENNEAVEVGMTEVTAR